MTHEEFKLKLMLLGYRHIESNADEITYIDCRGKTFIKGVSRNNFNVWYRKYNSRYGSGTTLNKDKCEYESMLEIIERNESERRRI